MMTNIRFVVPCLLIGLYTTAVLANDNEGWFEVTRGMIVTPATNSTRIASPSDYRLSTKPGDTLASIALSQTGMAEHAFSIARYNGLGVNDALPDNGVLLIPQALLKVPQKQGQVESAESRWQIQEFDQRSAQPQQEIQQAPASATLSERLLSSAIKRSAPVKTVNVDMFAGEVNVMGRVDVTRVAVGNGDVVRAEVRKSGELLVIAQSAGSTSLRLWHTDKSQSDFNIRVSASDPETRVRMETMVRMRVRMVEFRKSAISVFMFEFHQQC